jgi:subtilisin family serine protease
MSVSDHSASRRHRRATGAGPARTRRALLATAVTVAAVATLGPGTATAAPSAPLLPVQGRSVPGQYVVVLKKPARTAAGDQARTAAVSSARSAGGTVTATFGRALNGFAARLSAEQLTRVRADAAVAYVTPDTVVRADTTQNNAIWGLDRTDQRNTAFDGRYRYAWTGSGVSAYVLDTGIRATHTQFGGRVGSGFTSINDGNGTNDCNGHGTHVSGTVGGSTYGIAKAVSLVPVRVLDCDGSGNTSTVIAGLDWVIANHTARSVANLSLSGPANQALDDAITATVTEGVTVGVAAGNNADDACQYSPARAPSAITVGATDITDSRDTGYSDYGTCVDLFAPGTDVTSAWYTSNTAAVTISGTSMATPHVVGVAALYLQAHPSATPAEVTAGIVDASTKNVVTNRGTGSPNRLLYTVTAAAPATPAQPDRLASGEGLAQGRRLCSTNGRYCLVQQSDGNTVLYKPFSRVLWARDRSSFALRLQSDGNLVGYDAFDNAVWSTLTAGNGASTLLVQTDGNLVLRRTSDNRVTWSTGTAQKPVPPSPSAPTDRLTAGQALLRGGVALTSPNGVYVFKVQGGDGNAVLYHVGVGALFATGPADDDWFRNQSDGNLVLYRSDGAVMGSSGTAGLGAGTLTLQNDGNLVLYRNSDHRVIWSTGTAGL